MYRSKGKHKVSGERGYFSLLISNIDVFVHFEIIMIYLAELQLEMMHIPVCKKCLEMLGMANETKSPRALLLAESYISS